MDYGMLPPETNAARMYAGAGSAPMLAAADAWDGLAAELHDTAASYGSVISGLTGDPWQGSASEAMAAAAAPYVTWLAATAAHAERSARQARAAAAAYEAAHAMTVPPPVVAGNRSTWMSLVANNFLGQNTPAIATIQGDYAEMWARNAEAMYSYAGNSAAASRLTPFTSPPRTTSPAGPVARAAGASAATNSRAMLTQLMATAPQTLQGLSSPLPSAAPTLAAPGMSGPPAAPPALSLGSGSIFGPPSPGAVTLPRSLPPIGSSIPMPLANISKEVAHSADAEGLPVMLEALLNWLGSKPGASRSPVQAGPGGAPEPEHSPVPGAAVVSAGRGRATTIGALSVPNAWTGGPATDSLSAQSPTTGVRSASTGISRWPARPQARPGA